jgi:hypothetical protein
MLRFRYDIFGKNKQWRFDYFCALSKKLPKILPNNGQNLQTITVEMSIIN